MSKTQLYFVPLVSQKESERFTLELLIFFHASALNAKDYIAKLPIWSIHRNGMRLMRSIPSSVIATWNLRMKCISFCIGQKETSTVRKELCWIFTKTIISGRSKSILTRSDHSNLGLKLDQQSCITRSFYTNMQDTFCEYINLSDSKFFDQCLKNSSKADSI